MQFDLFFYLQLHTKSENSSEDSEKTKSSIDFNKGIIKTSSIV